MSHLKVYKSDDFKGGKIALNLLYLDIVRDKTLSSILFDANGVAHFSLTRINALMSTEKITFESSVDLDAAADAALDALVGKHSPADDDYTVAKKERN